MSGGGGATWRGEWRLRPAASPRAVVLAPVRPSTSHPPTKQERCCCAIDTRSADRRPPSVDRQGRCRDRADRGAHVWLFTGKRFCKDWCYIVPVCAAHNAKGGLDYPVDDLGRLAQGGFGFRTKPGTRALRIRPHERYQDYWLGY